MDDVILTFAAKSVAAMKVTEYFEKAKDQTLISFEVLPPLKGGRMQDIFDALDPLMERLPQPLSRRLCWNMIAAGRKPPN